MLLLLMLLCYCCRCCCYYCRRRYDRFFRVIVLLSRSVFAQRQKHDLPDVEVPNTEIGKFLGIIEKGGKGEEGKGRDRISFRYNPPRFRGSNAFKEI